MKIWRGPRWHYRIEEFEALWDFLGMRMLRCPKFEKHTGNFVLGDFFFPTHHEVSGLNRFVSS